ncbi:MAG TPA: hypothetical protein VMZ71_05650 [Gemmataceae bacterium]|nr:hypothetical protein [Gemmataceae bacterium]
MIAHNLRFFDRNGRVLATGRATDEGGYLGGTADWSAAPAPVLALFAEFEEVVDGQMFAFLDDVQRRIQALGITAAFDGGGAIDLTDLQVFPSTGDFSFRLVPVPSATV